MYFLIYCIIEKERLRDNCLRVVYRNDRSIKHLLPSKKTIAHIFFLYQCNHHFRLQVFKNTVITVADVVSCSQALESRTEAKRATKGGARRPPIYQRNLIQAFRAEHAFALGL